MNNLIKKSSKAIKEGGVKTLVVRIVGYTKEKVFHIPPITPEDVQKQQEELERIAEEERERVRIEHERKAKEEEALRKKMYPPMVDVLFINGCDESVPHPARYRVTHQREQLAAFNVSSEEVYYVNLTEDMVKYAQLFIFFRCPHTDVIERMIKKAKELNKTVLFDIDDLVIDTKYTDKIKYIQAMSEDEKRIYDDGVNRMGNTLKLCEGAITTTKRLQEELSHYVPYVFINRNTASEEMYELSENTVKRENDNEIRIGYFSGSITHNDDFKLVMPVLIKLFKKYDFLKLYLVGELDLPDELEPFRKQIVINPFTDWRNLPQMIADVDINIAPLEQGIFNEAKSENKWVEAALVKVPTVASNVGAFAEMIMDKETGLLCDSEYDWETSLESLIKDEDLRCKLAESAYSFVKNNCLTLYSGKRIADFIKEKMKPSVVFVFPSTEISGGIMVALKHASILQDKGYNVTIIADNPSLDWMEYDNHSFPVLSNGKNEVYSYFDKAVATMWTTTPFIETYGRAKERYYLVQNYETDFYPPNNPLRVRANQTYNIDNKITYITISKWCKEWLKNDYDKEAGYAPNGIDLTKFTQVDRVYSGKIKILIEGDCAVDYKRVDESFSITNQLPRDKFEVWYMSYNEKPKDWYLIDKFLHRVPYDEVPKVYQQCHILLKSSSLESFSYPPLEMMATGGFVVVAPNGGNIEYIKNEYNCLTYYHNINDGIMCINRIVSDEDLRIKLLFGMKETVSKRDWRAIERQICQLYNI